MKLANAMMRKVNAKDGTSFLIVTHNMTLAQRCDHTIGVVDDRGYLPDVTTRQRFDD